MLNKFIFIRNDNTLEQVATLEGHQLGIVSLAKNQSGTGIYQ